MNLRLATFIAVALSLPVPLSAQAQAPTRGRTLAPGVLTVIPMDPNYSETYTGPMELVEVTKGQPDLKWTPNFPADTRTVFSRASNVILRREIWNLEFAFKPLRMVEIDVPQASGKMQRKLVWYLVYRVKYTGSDYAPQARADNWGHRVFDAAPLDREGRFFFPTVTLVSHDYGKAYLDRLIPAAIGPIEEREKIKGLLNSVEIGRKPIPLSSDGISRPVWGVMIWEDVDPRIDYFSLYIKGLTNAYQPKDADGFQPGDPPGKGRTFLSKTLRLNFWRPGDTLHEHEGEIRFGVPVDPDKALQQEILDKFGLTERLDYQWVYR